MSYLTKHDLDILMRDRSPERRAMIAGKVAAQFSIDKLSDAERDLAESIFRALTSDVEILVRKTLATHLRACRTVPHDIATSLAYDMSEVAEPILRYSEVLTEDDLIDIIQTRSTDAHSVIAKRRRVSEKVSDALVATRERDVVSVLVRNAGAEISEQTFDRVLNDFGADTDIQEGIVYRPSLPLRTVERLVSLVSDHLRDYLIANHDLPPHMANALVQETQEQAVAQVLGADQQTRDVEGMVNQMFENDRLTPGVVFKALETGDLAFFEYAMAARAKIAVETARQLMLDSGASGFLALYRQAQMPDQDFKLTRFRVDTAYGVVGGNVIQGSAGGVPEPTVVPYTVGDDFAEFYDQGWINEDE